MFQAVIFEINNNRGTFSNENEVIYLIIQSSFTFMKIEECVCQCFLDKVKPECILKNHN